MTKRNKFLILLSVTTGTIFSALVLSTIAWFKDMSFFNPTNVKSGIIASYFDSGSGTQSDPYVITRPIHYYHLSYLQNSNMEVTYTVGEEEVTCLFSEANLYFQFGKQNIDGIDGNADDQAYLFYNYNDDGVLQTGSSPYLNMNYYSGDKAIVPIGNAARPFIAHIDGHNTTIKNLHINGSGLSDIGIFGYVGESATIANAYFDNCTIDAAGADADAESHSPHVAHSTHVYTGYLAGHVFNPESFTEVYINDCKILNSSMNNYEMINKHGYFGHTDQQISSTSNSSSYSTQLNAASAYDAIGWARTNGADDTLAVRNSEVLASGKFGNAVTLDSNNTSYTIKDKNGDPYSLSTIGYSSGDNGVDAYARYIETIGSTRYLREINKVEDNNVLDEKPANDFYGYTDGEYIYFDSTAGDYGEWKYGIVEADTSQPSQVSTVELNCFTISYTQTISGTTKKYYLKYQEKQSGQTYDTLVVNEWNSNQLPTANEYYFCFKNSFSHNGASRFTECQQDAKYYIFSPVGQKYLTTYAPQNVSGNRCESANLLHTPVFVPENGQNGHMPLKFTVSGPQTLLAYEAVDNGTNGTVANNCFDNNPSTNVVKGALQGSNLTTNGSSSFGLFGGHKQTAYCTGGTFTIGEYKDNQTTTLTDAINFKLTSSSSEITEGSTLLIAGYDREDYTDYTLDYAMASQASDYRLLRQVKETKERVSGSYNSYNYIINDTTGIAKMTIHYTSGSYSSNGSFTLFDNGFLYSPSADSDNLWTQDFDYDINDDTEDICKWRFVTANTGASYTGYRFKNIGHSDRYICYNNVDKYFYCKEKIADQWSGNISWDNTHQQGRANTEKWFYIYKMQTGQTIPNVHYTVSVTKTIDTNTYPYKNVTEYDLMYLNTSDGLPHEINKYQVFTKMPSNGVRFDTAQSQVHYTLDSIETWKRVSNVSDLKNGDNVVITGNNRVFMSTTQNNASSGGWNSTPTYRGYVNPTQTINPPYIKKENVPTTAQVFTIVKVNNVWRFDTGDGFLYAPSSSSDYLGTEQTPDANGNAEWSISVSTSTGDATITAQGNSSHKIMRYRASGGGGGWGGGSSTPQGFYCYTDTSQSSVQIYKLVKSGTNDAVYVGDLMNNFEPYRMDAVGPNVHYYPSYIQMGTASTVDTPTVNSEFYPTSFVKNAFTLLVDYTGSRDLGTLIYDTMSTSGSSQPYFMQRSGSTTTTTTLTAAHAVDVGQNNDHEYILNLNESNILSLAYCCLRGDGTDLDPYEICASNDTNLTKYVIVLGCDTNVQTTNISFTFNNEEGNVGYTGTIDYRSAVYDTNGNFIGTTENGARVNESYLNIFYDVTNTGQLVSMNVYYNYNNGDPIYTITFDSDEIELTEDLVIFIYKYDNNASILNVIVNGVTTTYYSGAIGIVIPKTSS